MKKIGFAVIGILILFLAGYLLLSNNASLQNKIIRTTQRSSPQQDIKPGKPLTNGIHAADGYTVSLFAQGIEGARDLQFSPEGTLLVSAPGQGTVYALTDANADGVSDTAKPVVTGENIPHGLAFFDSKLYVADNDKIVQFDWDENSPTASNRKEVLAIPSGGNHIYRTIVFDTNGQMYVSIGSTCNVCIEKNPWFNSIITADKTGQNARIYATGQRNAPFLAFQPSSGTLFATGMGRDFLGDDLPPDEINVISDGKNYGWPYCYGNKVYDRNFGKGNPSDCQSTIPPVFEIPAHSAPLGLSFIESSQFPNEEQGDLLVSYHGSWNRSVPDGYKVVKMNVNGSTIRGATDFITGFIQGRDVIGRPVDLTFDKNGTLYISDDKAGVVYRVTK